MPFHRFYCSPNLFTKEDKQGIAKAITNFYHFLPPFLVIVNFIDVDKDGFYVGGEPNDRYVRINVTQSANPVPDRAWVEAWEKAIEPFTKAKGIDYELQMGNEDPSLWSVNGLSIPPFLGEDWMIWKKLNKPVEWKKSEESANVKPTQ
ncbi:putative oxalocrotonate tautomerase [Lentinula raphanica]|uniref:Oxalocrotonate tautomerase n=1 Tax=Lentinula raphanica TaxID=153919 RepID=A0AA38PEM3_9AGAR|nr:putative oxalocrotonate tautomerase [Lentinula raphanica]